MSAFSHRSQKLVRMVSMIVIVAELKKAILADGLWKSRNSQFVLYDSVLVL